MNNLNDVVKKIIDDDRLDTHTKGKAIIYVFDEWGFMPSARNLQGKEYSEAVYKKSQRVYQLYHDKFIKNVGGIDGRKGDNSF